RYAMEIDFERVGGYVASTSSVINDAVTALQAGNAVTMEVVVTGPNDYYRREYVSVWGYYETPNGYVGLICSNPLKETKERNVTDNHYNEENNNVRTFVNYVDENATDGQGLDENNFNTFHNYLLRNNGGNWEFVTGPYTYLDGNGKVQGASQFPEGFQFYGGYNGNSSGNYTARIAGFTWLQQYTDKLPECKMNQSAENGVFSLESMPGNTDNVVYLYFGGLDGQGWDGLAHPALNLDGAAGYGVNELKCIEEVWRRVAEDFAPFNVNVTTNADVWAAAKGGIRTVIGGYSPSAGGLSGVGVFGAAKNDNYVYPESLGLSTKNIAEAASHEIGHTFGLHHDGYEHNEYYGGNGVWAPIMGTGYGAIMTQWNDGDYINATNNQDETAVIAARVGYRVDQFKDTTDEAEPLDKHYVPIDFNKNYSSEIGTEINPLAGTYNVVGYIETPQDVDVFSFVSNGGTYVVDVVGAGADYRFIDRDFDWNYRRHTAEENAAFAGKYYSYSYDYTNLNLKVTLRDETGEYVLLDSDGNIMKLNSGEYYSNSRGQKWTYDRNYHFVVRDQFGKEVYENGKLKEGWLAVDDSVYTTFSHFVTPVLEEGKTYFITVEGVGQGTPETQGYYDYGSLGKYVLNMHESYENFYLNNVEMDVQTLGYATGVDNVLNWQEAIVYSGRRLEDGTRFLGNTLRFNESLSGETFNLNQTLTFDYSAPIKGQPYTPKRFVLDATPAWDNVNNQPGITLDAGGKFRTLYIDNTTIEMYGFVITGGAAETTNVIYLYFNGLEEGTTGWDGLLHPAFDIDGDPTTYSAQELDWINEVYLRVVEDYAPYNVTVTTDQAVFDAATNATRVVIGGYSPDNGGLAILGSFDTQKRDCYIYTDTLGSAKLIAEAVSHEVGHTLGLRHDGNPADEYYQGHGDWAPIMGVGYYRQLTQWSKGEYAGATNTEDDLATIATKIAFKKDEEGDDFKNPVSMTGSYLVSRNVVADGLLNYTGDVDYFSFVATGETVVVDVVGAGADFSRVDAEGYAASLGYTNIDLAVELYDDAGNLLYTCNPDSSYFCHFEANNLAVGEKYIIKVTGVGKGDPVNGGYSNYGSIGQYYVTVGTGDLADFVGEERYQSASNKIEVQNGAINATPTKAAEAGKLQQANNGGGVYNNYGWLTIGDSIIAGNRAVKAGGGIYNSGGEYTDTNQHDGWLYLINTSIIDNIVTKDNSIGGGFYNEDGGVATLVNVTIAGNVASYSGGGMENDGRVNSFNTIFAKNEAQFGKDVYNEAGASQHNAYNSLIGDESRNLDYTAYINGKNTNNRDGSLIGTSVGNRITSPIITYDPLFVGYRQYELSDWSPVLWKSWNLRLQGNSEAVGLGVDANLTTDKDYTIAGSPASQYGRLGQSRYKVVFDTDLAGQERIQGDSIDAGAYEVLDQPDLVGYVPRSAGADVVNDWENSIVISRAVDDQSGSIAPFLVDEQLYLNLSFINQGASIGDNFETTVYFWKYGPNASPETMSKSAIDGTETPFIKINVEFAEGGATMPGGGAPATVTVTEIATGRVLATLDYDGSTSYIKLENVGIGSIQELVAPYIDATVENEEGFYVFGYKLDSGEVIDEYEEENNFALTTSYFNVVESPVSVNNSIVVTTTEDVIDPYDGEISLREAVEVYAGSFYYREIALPAGASFECAGVTYVVTENGKFEVQQSSEYKVYPGDSFTFVETVETPVTWNGVAYVDARGVVKTLDNGEAAKITVYGVEVDAIWNETTNTWLVGETSYAPYEISPDVVVVEKPVVTVSYRENVYFFTEESGAEKAVEFAPGTKAKVQGVEATLKDGRWQTSKTTEYTRDQIQEQGSFFLADGTEVAVVNGVFRRVATGDVAVVLSGSTVTLADGRAAVYNAAQDRFVVTEVSYYDVKDGDSIFIGSNEYKFTSKAYVDNGGYRYYLRDGVEVTLKNGYVVHYNAAKDAFIFKNYQETKGKIGAGSSITILDPGPSSDLEVDKTYTYKAGVAVVEKVSREANAVVFAKYLDGETFWLVGDPEKPEKPVELTLDKSFTLDCVDPDGNILDLSIASQTSRLFHVKSTADVTIRNFVLKDSGFRGEEVVETADHQYDGGVILNEGGLTIESVDFVNNAAYRGGSIYNAGTLTVKTSSFSGDVATEGGSIYNAVGANLFVEGSAFEASGTNGANAGGAIYNAGTASIGGAIFVDEEGEPVGVITSKFYNLKAVDGAAIYNTGTLSVASSEFVLGVATAGGAIYNAAGTAFIGDARFVGQTAENGGALYNADGAKATIVGSTFEGNKAGIGGAIYNAGEVKIGGEIDGDEYDVNFSGNVANGAENADGGAIYSVGTLDVYSAKFTSNQAGGLGGAIYDAGALNIFGAAFVGNGATLGGAIYAENQFTANRLAAAQNKASRDGAAIYAANGIVISNSVLAKNIATGEGGAAFLAGTSSFVNVTIADNVAADGAGLFNTGDATLDNTIVAYNQSIGAGASGFDVYTAEGAVTSLRNSLLANIAQYGPVKFTLVADYRSLLGVDPQFVDAVNGDYTLVASSPAVNSGSNALANSGVDFAGQPRIAGLTVEGVVRTVDMGAFELQTIVAPDLAIDPNSVEYWTLQRIDVETGEIIDLPYFLADEEVTIDFNVQNVGTATVIDNFAYNVKLVGVNQKGETIYDATQSAVNYRDSFINFNWLNESDWIAPGSGRHMISNLGILPAGEYTITVTLDVEGVGKIYEFGEEDGYVGENNNVFVGSFRVGEAPSTIVTTDADVIDPYDYETSIREAIDAAGHYYKVQHYAVADGTQFVAAEKKIIDPETGEEKIIVNDGEILTVRNGALTRTVDVVYKDGVPRDLQTGDEFLFNGRKVVYHFRVNGGYFTDIDGREVDVTKGKLTYPDGSTQAVVSLNTERYISRIVNPSTGIHYREGQRYSYRMIEIPGQEPRVLYDGAQFEYANVKFTYYDVYVTEAGEKLNDGAFVFDNGNVVPYGNGELSFASLKVGALSTRDAIVSDEILLKDGRIIQVNDGVAAVKTTVDPVVTFHATKMRDKTIVVSEELGRVAINKDVVIDGEDRGVAISGGGERGIFEVTAIGDLELRDLTLKDAKGSMGAAIYSDGVVTTKNVDFINNSVKLTLENLDHVLTDGIGGAVYSSGKFTAEGGSFKNNSASEFGGAIFSMGDLKLTNVAFEGNSAYVGGAVSAYRGSLFVDGGTFQSNVAERGGAVYTLVDATFIGATFINNEATGTQNEPLPGVGGAVYAHRDARLTFLSPKFVSGDEEASNVAVVLTGNKAAGSGGAVYAEGGIDVVQGDFIATGNVAGNADYTGLSEFAAGGAVCTRSPFEVEGNLVMTDNASTGSYGAAYLNGDFRVTGDVDFSGSKALNGD
ncbi:MAG: hypothetical protein HUK22_01700, partial [Thermoguttaceae bacterium]|nr:hypothetical protein [Thermoguttaceae bacterium]